jgi:hypothetical protein
MLRKKVWQKKIVHGDGIKKIFPANSKSPPPPPSKVKWSAPNAFVSPGVNSRGELVPSPRA